MNELEKQLHYPFAEALPEPGATLTVAPGVKWIRMALPFALNHINLWLLRDELDGVPVAVPRGEIHPGIHRSWIPAEGVLDRAQVLDEIAPVHRAEEPEAGDAVADGDLVCGLVPAFQLHQQFNGESMFGQPLFEPANAGVRQEGDHA